MKTYLLTYDNGRDYLQMEFSSDFRLNSKGNRADAEKAMQKRSRYSTIVAIERITNDKILLKNIVGTSISFCLC